MLRTCGVGASDLSTSLGCPTMIKDLYAHRQKVQGERGTGLWIEVPKKQRHLENTLGNQPYWTVELQGRQKSRVSNKKKKYLGI